MDKTTFTQQELALVIQVFEMSKISPLQAEASRVCEMSQGIVRKMQSMLETAPVVPRPEREEATNNHVEAGL